MKKYDKEELQILKDIEEGKYKSLEGAELNEMKELLQVGAKNILKKGSERKAISIRVFKDDITKLKSIADKEGLSYQTFITSTLHKVATGKVKI